MLLELLIAALPLQTPTLPAVITGAWRATLASPGGELPFELVIDAGGSALVGNGEEHVEVPEVRFADGELVLGFPHYDSAIRARLVDGALRGAWEKRGAAAAPARMEFQATHGATPRFPPEPKASGADAPSIAGRWSVRFSSSSDPAVGVFEERGGLVTGTFLTTTGDYRYLAGVYANGRLRLSCFDGAHAFLFDARASGGALAGTFHSGPTWKEDWTATRDDGAKLPDEWSLTRWDEALPLSMLVFPDLQGASRSLAEWQSTSNAMMLVVFGSWCPNCHDELRDLAEFDRRMRPKGLSIVGLAFEHSGDFERDAQQVRRALLRHKVSFPVLLAGSSAKEKAAEALPQLSGVHAFPTTVFFHRDGRARAVHTGYSGPGTGAAHTALLGEFERIAMELVEEPEPDLRDTWSRIATGSWVDLPYYFRTTIFRDASGARFLSDDPNWQPDGVQTGLHDMRAVGSSVWFGERLYAFDLTTSVFLDPFDAGHRLVAELPLNAPTVADYPVPEPVWTLRPETVDEASRSPLARMRREAVYVSVRAFHKQLRAAPLDPTPFLSDPDVQVRCTAAWAAGELRVADALEKLAENARHGFAPLRREVARALKKLGKPAARPTLELLAKDFDPLVRIEARTALSELGQ
ncbi:MAG: HEAT repeat domain-containing protein [Planctomycetes bacterium]|nr:HEAT repeat domain-containing protein [Planctomycetota bacterium]